MSDLPTPHPSASPFSEGSGIALAELWPDTLAEQLAHQHKNLMLEREREAFQAAQSGDKARQSIASTESERHRAVYHAMCLVVADENKRRLAALSLSGAPHV